jgi:predicted SAM-dependent methyltransferase
MKKLHLGCGDKYLPGFIHIDARPGPRIDHVHDISNLDFLSNDSFDEIYACHVLEHFKKFQIIPVLKEWNRVLKKGGIIRLSVPSFEAIVEEYSKKRNLPQLLGLLYGGQTYEYNFHYTIFDIESLTMTLKECGFDNIKPYRWENFLPENYDDFSRAYLPHMDFKNGCQMSLNVTASKV